MNIKRRLRSKRRPRCARVSFDAHGGRAFPGRPRSASAALAYPLGPRRRCRVGKRSQQRGGPVAATRLPDPVPGLEACTTVPDPASRFVKGGARNAEEAHQEHSIVQPVGGGSHAGEAAELDMEALRNTRLDRSTAHHRRSEIRSIACPLPARSVRCDNAPDTRANHRGTRRVRARPTRMSSAHCERAGRS